MVNVSKGSNVNVDKMVVELNEVLAKCDEVFNEMATKINYNVKDFRETVPFETLKKTENFYNEIQKVTNYISYTTHLLSIINMLSITLKELRLTSQFRDVIVRVYGEGLKNKVNYKIDNLETMKEILITEKESADKQYRLYSSMMYAHTNFILKSES